MTPDYSWFPEIHRPGGSRSTHDDFKLWPLTLIPRHWTAFPQGSAPRMLWGSQRYWNSAQPQGHDSFIGPQEKCPWPEYGAKPIPPVGTWQLSLSYPVIFGKTIPVPYFAITFKTFTFYASCRWSDGPSERYYNLGAGFKKVRKSEAEK